MSVYDLSQKIKSFWAHILRKDDVIVVLIIGLVGIASFGLGRLSQAKNAPAEPVVIEGGVLPYQEGISEEGRASEGNYVASRNGERYYPPSCSSVSRIKEENKVWFASKEEAEQAGFTQSTTCSY